MGRAACLCRRTDIEAHPTLEWWSKRRNTSMFMHVPESLYIRAPFSTASTPFGTPPVPDISGMLHLSWFLRGYQQNDTPPGGALIFEVRQSPAGQTFIRVFYAAQSLDQMRASSQSGDAGSPLRAPVYVPGCPALDCPMPTFDSVVGAAIDPAFVGSW